MDGMAQQEPRARRGGRVVHNAEKSDRIVIFLPKALGETVAAWQKRQMLPNRSEAIRQILIRFFEEERARETKPKK